jgi:pimeloyl-ACP methyl ester carboxylesterase
MWVLDLLATKRDVISIDLPGLGDALKLLPVGTTSSVEALTDAVQAFIGELGLTRPHITGNSLGGAIALELARRSAVRSVTALAPIGF